MRRTVAPRGLAAQLAGPLSESGVVGELLYLAQGACRNGGIACLAEAIDVWANQTGAVTLSFFEDDAARLDQPLRVSESEGKALMQKERLGSAQDKQQRALYRTMRRQQGQQESEVARDVDQLENTLVTLRKLLELAHRTRLSDWDALGWLAAPSGYFLGGAAVDYPGDPEKLLVVADKSLGRRVVTALQGAARGSE